MKEAKESYTKGRITYIDWAKTICIFLMIVGHHENNRIILSYIYAFHMPAFFAISGFLYRPHPWKETLIAFSFPVVAFSLINLTVNLLLGSISVQSLTFQYVVIHTLHWRHGLGECFFKGVWFIWAIVGIRFVFGDIKQIRLVRKYYIPIALLLTIYMALENYHVSIDTLFHGYNIGTIVPSLPFFCLGLFLKDKKWHPKRMSVNMIVPLALLFLIIPITDNYCDIYNSSYGYSYLMAAINASLFTLLLFGVTSKLPSSKYIETLSKGTLVILGTHWTILQILYHVLPDSMNILFPFITIVICYYIIVFCERYCPILLGKRRNILFTKGCNS